MRRSVVLGLLCLLLGAAAGAGHALLADREYAAGAAVVVSPVEGGDPAAALGFAQAWARLATDDTVLRRARPEAGVPAGTLRARVRARISPEAPVIEITGTGPRPRDAARTANAVARALLSYAGDTREETRTTAALLTPAVPPTAPATPVAWLSLATGTCAGAVAATTTLLTRRRTVPPAVTPPPPVPPQPAPAVTGAEVG